MNGRVKQFAWKRMLSMPDPAMIAAGAARATGACLAFRAVMGLSNAVPSPLLTLSAGQLHPDSPLCHWPILL